MIEVRSSYVVRARDIRDAMALWKSGRDEIWPKLGFDGRLQQMLHGHCQQSLLVWSSEWNSMAAWEEGMKRTTQVPEYRAWSAELNKLREYGAEREVFTAFGQDSPLDGTPGKVEVRSAYLVKIASIPQVRDLMMRAQREVWPALGWGGQNQQMLHGRASQSQFVWTSTWDNLAAWEAGMARTVGHEGFQAWYREFLEAVDVGANRDVFKNF